MNAARKRFHRYLVLTIVVGVLTIVSPLVGLAGTVIGMRHAFDTMGTQGSSDPGHLSQNIGEVLIATMTGLGVAAIGLPLFVVFLVKTVQEHKKVRQMESESPPEAET